MLLMKIYLLERKREIVSFCKEYLKKKWNLKISLIFVINSNCSLSSNFKLNTSLRKNGGKFFFWMN